MNNSVYDKAMDDLSWFLYEWSGIYDDFKLCSVLFLFVKSSKLNNFCML